MNEGRTWRRLSGGLLLPSTSEADREMTVIADSVVLSLAEAKQKVAMAKADKVSKAQDVRASLDPRFKKTLAKSYKDAKKKMDQSQQKLKRDLYKLFLTRETERGRMDFEDFRQRSIDRLHQGHKVAFELGLKAAGLPDKEAKITANKETEAKFDQIWGLERGHFLGLLTQIQRDEQRGTPTSRSRNYADAVTATFDAARTFAMPSLSIFNWRLEDAKACPDCHTLYKHSPYTRDNLATVPKGGVSRCRSNCRCVIEVTQGTARQVEAIRRKHISRKDLVALIMKQQKRKR